MAMNPGFQQQRPLLNSATVRSAPAQQHGAHLDVWRTTGMPRPAEEKTFGPPDKR